MSISRTALLALAAIASVSVGLKQIKYAHDRVIWGKGSDLALKHLLHDNGYAAEDWQVTHGGFAGSYRFTRQGCADLFVLSLRNSEDGVVSAYQQHIKHLASGNDARPVFVIEGQVHDQIPYLPLYYSLIRDEARRMLDLRRYPASFMVFPDPRTFAEACRLTLTWKTYRI